MLPKRLGIGANLELSVFLPSLQVYLKVNFDRQSITSYYAPQLTEVIIGVNRTHKRNHEQNKNVYNVTDGLTNG